MSERKCLGINQRGERCRATPMRDSPYCMRHNPELTQQRAEWDSNAGKSKSNAARAAKRLPADLQDTLKTLYRALGALEAGEMEPARASAMASVCRAIVTVFEMGDAERRIAEIEALLQEKSA